MDAILPQIAGEFGVSIGSVAFVATMYALAYGFFQLFFGPAGDWFGKYRVIFLACIGSSIATYACALTDTLAGIATARLASGMAAAAIVPLAIAWVGDVVPDDDRQAVLAKFLSGQILGLLAGQIGGGVLGEYFGWRAAFVFIATIYLFAVAGMFIELMRNPATQRRPNAGTASFGKSFGTLGRLVRQPVVRFVLVMVAIESFAMFGASLPQRPILG